MISSYSMSADPRTMSAATILAQKRAIASRQRYLKQWIRPLARQIDEACEAMVSAMTLGMAVVVRMQALEALLRADDGLIRPRAESEPQSSVKLWFQLLYSAFFPARPRSRRNRFSECMSAS